MSKPSKHIQRSYDRFSNTLDDLLRRQRKLQKALVVYQERMGDFLEILTDTEIAYDAALVALPVVKNRRSKKKENSNKEHKLPAGSEVTSISAGGEALLAATKQMQETQMSFNLQYLQLQSAMQHENRSYTAISNIMKTKHDTVKNSISNIR